MFMDELMPIFKELTKQPFAFLGGFCSGILGLSLYEDPLSSWLAKQVGAESDASSAKAGNSTGRWRYAGRAAQSRSVRAAQSRSVAQPCADFD